MLFTCIQIFLARIVDVSLGTIRTVYFVKGKTIEPFIIAFFEVLIWYVIAKEALNTEGNTFLIASFYAGGYATGTLIGSKISKKIISSDMEVQAIIKNSKEIEIDLKNNNYKYSIIPLKDNKNVMLYVGVSSKKIDELIKIIKKYEKHATILINETKLINNNILK